MVSDGIDDTDGESPEYKDSAESLEDLQREYLGFAKEQMLELKRDKRRRDMTHPPSMIGYASTADISGRSIQIRRIDNGWVVVYWAGRPVEMFCKTEEVGAFTASAALDLEKHEKVVDQFA